MLKEPVGFCLWAAEVPQQKGQSSLPCPSAPPHPHQPLLICTTFLIHSSSSLSSTSFCHLANIHPPIYNQSSPRTHPLTHLLPSPPLLSPMGLFTWIPSGKCPFHSIISILCPACARICANPSPGPWLSADSGAEVGYGVLGIQEGHWVGAQNRHTCSLWDSRELRRAEIQQVPLKLQGDEGNRGESLGYFPCTVNSNTNPASPVGP